MTINLKNIAIPFLLAIPCSLSAQSKPAILPLDPAVRTGKLPNGFTYYIRHNEEPKNRVVMYLVNKAGSVLENENQRGIAHFMEHMSFNGTKHFPKNDLVNYLQKSGIRFGADLNAYTSFDETVYQLPIPSDKPELLKGGLQIMRDWAQEATLDTVEINKERGVVLEEKRLGKGAPERMQRIYWPMLMNQSRYAERLPIGIDTVLNHFRPETIRSFYKDWYRPDLQALIVVGDINIIAMEKQVRQQFSSLKNPLHERSRRKFTIPLDGRNQFTSVTDKEMTTTTAEIIIKHPMAPLKTVGDYRKLLVRNLFNQMLGERYGELTRQANPAFIDGGAAINNFMGGLDVYDASVTLKPGELETGIKALWRETERVKRFGFTVSELQRAKNAILRQSETELKEKDKTNSEAFVREYQQYFLLGMAAPGVAVEYQLTKNDLPSITLNEVNSLTKAYIVAINRDIIILAPDKDRNSLPNEAQVNKWLKSVAGESLQPYQDLISEKPLLTRQPVPGKVVAEQVNKNLNITTITLSNGVKVVLKPTSFKNDEILFSAFAQGGTSLSNDSDFQSAQNAAGVISACGVGNYDINQLQKYLQGKELKVEPYIQDRYQGISGGSTFKEIETSLQMIYAYFTEPRKDTTIFKNIIERSKAELTNRANSPDAIFNDTISAVLGNYHIRKTGPTVAKLQQINLEKAFTVYKDRFADAAGFTFIFVGSFTIQNIKPLLEYYLGALPVTNKKEDYKDLGINIPAGTITKTVYKGTEPKATVLLVYSGPFEYSQENTVSMAALKEALEIRLLQRLREDESGVYSPSVFVNTSKYPQQRYSFYIQFGCAPQNVDKLIACVQDEIRKLRTQGPPQENVDKWCTEEKTTITTQLKTNTFWLNYLNDQLQNKEDLQQVDRYYEMLDQVTPNGVKKTAAKYLNGENYIRLELLPEKKLNK